MINLKKHLISTLTNGNLSLLEKAQNRARSKGNLVDITNSTLNIPDLEDVDLSNIDFSGTTFLKCNLNKVSIINCNLNNCIFEGGTYYETDFSYSSMVETKFSTVRLMQNLFYKSDLEKSTLSHCSLKRGLFIGSNLQDMFLDDCILKFNLFKKSELRGLDYNFNLDIDFNVFYKCTHMPLIVSVEEGRRAIKDLKKKLRSPKTPIIDRLEDQDEFEGLEGTLGLWSEQPDYYED